MNRIIQILGLIIICLTFTDLTWVQSTFERTYGGKFYDTGNDVIETPDNNFIIIGTTRSASNNTNGDAYVLKIDGNGDTLWTNIYGGELDDGGVKS